MIRPLPNGRWQADYFKQSATPPRTRKTFDSKEQAQAWLDIRHIERGNRTPPLKPRDELDAREALAMLPPGTRLVDAARAYAATHPRDITTTLREAWNIFEVDRTRSGLRAISINALRSTCLHQMAEKLPATLRVSNVSADDLENLLGELRASPTSRNNLLRAWHNFFEFCIRKGYRGDNPTKRISRARLDEPAPEIYTPEQTARWLKHIAATRPKLLAFYAIGFLSGIRTGEIEKMCWADVGTDHIVIRPRVAKRRSQRIVPICPALRAMLAQCPPPPRPEASIAPLRQKARITWLKKQVQEHGLPPWLPNVMRHSWISYRLAATQNAPQVALEAGNSVEMIHRHYLHMTTPGAAAAYFSIGI